MSWPKGKPRPPEVRAKISAALKSRLQGEAGDAERERLRHLLDVGRRSQRNRSCARPPVGTDERRYFDKVARIIGPAAAHAELRRGGHVP